MDFFSASSLDPCNQAFAGSDKICTGNTANPGAAVGTSLGGNSVRGYMLFILLAFCSGCTVPTRQIIPGSEGGRFVLEEDFVEFEETRFGDRFLVGLVKGEYIAVGHDEKGVYYRGPYRCQVFLSEQLGKRFLATGERPGALDTPGVIELFGDEGGVFVPYSFANEQAYYFHYADYRNVTGDLESRIPPRPVSSINDPEPETMPAGADYPLPRVKVINPANPGALPPAGAAVAGAAGLVVARKMGHSVLSRAQGGIVSGRVVTSERILAVLRRLETR